MENIIGAEAADWGKRKSGPARCTCTARTPSGGAEMGHFTTLSPLTKS